MSGAPAVTASGEQIADPVAYWKAKRAFTGTACCGATAKGGDGGLVCRACYRFLPDEEAMRVERESAAILKAQYEEVE